MSTHDQTSPVALHRLISRLLDDHQRMNAHNAHLCPLCQDTSNTLDLLADEVPDDFVWGSGADDVLTWPTTPQ